MSLAFPAALGLLAAIGLVYGSLLAFRARDVRGVVAYSSMGQMSLIVLGLFSLTELGVTGAIVQSVAHGLVSATLFLLAGMIETRTGGTSDYLLVDARGRATRLTLSDADRAVAAVGADALALGVRCTAGRVESQYSSRTGAHHQALPRKGASAPIVIKDDGKCRFQRTTEISNT